MRSIPTPHHAEEVEGERARGNWECTTEDPMRYPPQKRDTKAEPWSWTDYQWALPVEPVPLNRLSHHLWDRRCDALGDDRAAGTKLVRFAAALVYYAQVQLQVSAQLFRCFEGVLRV